MEYSFQEVSLKDLKNTFIRNDKNISHKLEENYIDFKKEYFKNTNFENFSFKIKNLDNEIICPLTLQKDNEKKFNFFGDEVQVFYLKDLSNELNSILKEVLKNILKTNKVKNIKFKIKVYNPIKPNIEDSVELVKNEIFVDLSKSEKDMLLSFKPNLRNEIKKENENVSYQIINSDNYLKDEMFRMKDMHELVSGKKTRSHASWEINEKMLKNKNALMVKVNQNNTTISYSLFYYNKITCSYFSSCSLREYFKQIRNIQHKTIFNVAKYMQNKSKYLYLGSSTEYSKTDIDPKVANIEKFKSKFSKKKNFFKIYNKIPDKF
tara:strand:- start:686 stop:1648 length:963 start_codon:yes stop_codon:yes gene_type:complete